MANRTQPLWKVFLAFVVLALTTTTKTAEAQQECHGTQLVVLAGPRRSATSSVAEFFHKYARGAQPNHNNGRIYHPLGNSRWPLVYGPHTNQTETEMPYKRFNHLVTDSNNAPLKQEILDAIKTDYELASVNAVIFGGEEFDQVLGVGEKGYNAVQAVQEVVDYVNAPPECVTIVLVYRIPRFLHWVSLYSSIHQDEYISYEEHMCEDTNTQDRLMELGTSMNPMFLAEAYLGGGVPEGTQWKVKMVDMLGVESFETDISHTIGCNILGNKCDDEGKWVKGHNEESITNKVLEADFKSLPKKETELSEKLFQYRDCSYQEDLENEPRFEVIMRKGIWADCEHDEDHEWVYNTFRDMRMGTHLVYDGLLSQVDCSKYGGHPSYGDRTHSVQLEDAKIEDFLDGTFQKSHGVVAFLEDEIEEIENGHFSAPLVLVILMFAGGAGFYVMKMRAEDGVVYTIPSFEMRGFSDRGRVSIGSAKKNDNFEDEDDSSSGEDESDSDSDEEDPDAGEFI